MKARKTVETLTDRVKEIRRDNPGLDERLRDYRERRRAYDSLRSGKKPQPVERTAVPTQRKYRV